MWNVSILKKWKISSERNSILVLVQMLLLLTVSGTGGKTYRFNHKQWPAKRLGVQGLDRGWIVFVINLKQSLHAFCKRNRIVDFIVNNNLTWTLHVRCPKSVFSKDLENDQFSLVCYFNCFTYNRCFYMLLSISQRLQRFRSLRIWPRRWNFGKCYKSDF